MSYLQMDRFITSSNIFPVLQCLNGKIINKFLCTYLQEKIDNVHNHICLHASYTDWKIYLK